MSKPYTPSNGTEGTYFIDTFCVRCWYDRNEDCPILAASFLGRAKEWVCDDDGQNARCEQFHDQVKGAPKEFPLDTKAQLKLELDAP